MSAIDWPLDSNHIRRGLENNTFGWVRHYPNGRRKPHQGWDLYAALGTPCFAVADGRVQLVYSTGAYGKVLVLAFDFQGARRYAAYCHLDRIDVQQGQQVSLGQQVGLTGITGNAQGMTGPDRHLHFEFRTEPRPGLGLEGRLSPLKLFGEYPRDRTYQRRALH